MTDLTTGLVVYEVCVILLDSDGDELETFENEYVVCHKDHTYSTEDIIAKSLGTTQLPDEPVKVQVYEARSASLVVSKDNSVEVSDVDFMGYSCSPIYEAVV